MRTFLHLAALAALPLLTLGTLPAADDYKPGPDSLPQPGVAKGEVIKDTYKAVRIFPGTIREVAIYIPAGLDKSKPTPFMVFQDGVIYQAPVVLDNLIAQKEIPPLIGIFIKPGVVPAANENALPRFNRSHEYDSVTSEYVTFLLEELLPTMEKSHGLNLTQDPNGRAIAGSSSGGICAFVAAWHRPDAFRRVFTNVGTYVGIHNADQFPVLVRKVEPKPIRIFLQSGLGDNNLYCGDWWMANQMMERSLTWAGYEVNHEWGDGGHNQKHATAIFPEALRWLWKGYPEEPLKANPKGESKWKGYEVVQADAGWSEVPLPEKFDGARDLTANAKGEVFLTGRRVSVPNTDGTGTISKEGIWKMDMDGKLVPFSGEWDNVRGIGIDRVGLVRVAVWNASNGGKRRCQFLSLDEQGQPTGRSPGDVLEGDDDAVYPSRMTLAHSGWCFFASAKEGDPGLTAVSPEGKLTHLSWKKLAGRPYRLALSPDQTLLYVTSSGNEEMVSCYQIAEDGYPSFGQPFLQLQRDIASRSGNVGAGGICVDTEGRVYVATATGIQVCDQAGRVNFIIPTLGEPGDVCFAGKDLSELYIVSGGRLYKRPTKVHGVVSGQQAPLKPAAPKL
ncbi:MAG TPA: alpha/beta hydrolase-fold protein [Verrucomicrobium sp.]|nr:alpha/beta hydrolase-fold protein [Verrucomicrobium sp.]